MRNSNKINLRIADAALGDAISSAQWDRIDLQTRRPGQDPDERLLAKAAELALSPIARDQLLSTALEHEAQRFHPDYATVDMASCSHERSVIADRVFALGSHKASVTEAVVLAIEERHLRRLRQDVRFDLLAECLRQDAVLQEAFWNHPGIPASDEVRLSMLCTIPKLAERADFLSSPAGNWLEYFPRWFARPAKRRER